MTDINCCLKESPWRVEGATLSDKSARNEFGITQEETILGIKLGKLQFRENNMHGSTYFKLVREEVKNFVIEKYGKNYFKFKLLENELGGVDKKIRGLKRELIALEKRSVELNKQLELAQ